MNCVYFTICSNNYLSFATVLYRSLKAHHPAATFILFLCDERIEQVDYAGVADRVVVLSAIEPRFNELASRYNIVELNTSLKPLAFEYLFGSGITHAVYLDPDIRVFSSLETIETSFETASILLTPHIYTPIPFDGYTPQESSFLNFGIYNLGFIGLKATNETAAFLKWWKNWTYEKGYVDVYNGIFVDQLPVNHVPVFFDQVMILRDMGLNMAPWNLHERKLTIMNGNYMINQTDTLKFYHFSSFNTNNAELPVEKYNRFRMSDRPDLHQLYQQYRTELMDAGYAETSKLPNAWQGLREAFLKEKKKQKWKRRLLFWQKKRK